MLHYLSALVLASTAALGFSPAAGEAAKAPTFRNPIFVGGDPWIIRAGGVYYYCAANCGIADICVKQSRSLSGLAKAPWIGVWTHTKDDAPNAHEVWAPELHLIGDRWYIYYAADAGSNEDHRLYVLSASKPTGPFVQADTGKPNGRLDDSTGHWAIDPDVFTAADGKLYLTWSCTNYNDSKFPQRICLAPMRDPLHVDGPTVYLSTPTKAWEKRGKPIQEGPVGYTRSGRTYITYSASASWIPNDYAVGLFTLTRDAPPLKASSWKKSGPIFDHTPTVYGPGSVVFVPSPDDTQWWNFYHAIERLDCDPAYRCRDIRMQPMRFDAAGAPILGKPIGKNVPIVLPSGDAKAADKAK